MAKVGFEYIVIAKLMDQTPTYEAGRYLGKASTFNGTPTVSDVKDYGDDGVAETDTSVTGGTLSLEVNENTCEIYAFTLGHEYDAETKECISKADDIAPYLGVGAVGKSKRNNKNVYTGKFYFKVQFKEPNDENATKQENTTFTHTTLEGNIFKLDDERWKSQREFTTLKEAKEWLDKMVGITTEITPTA